LKTLAQKMTGTLCRAASVTSSGSKKVFIGKKGQSIPITIAMSLHGRKKEGEGLSLRRM